MFKEHCKFPNIKKTRTSPNYPQCDDQVARINRTLIELFALKVKSPIKNWDVNLGVVLIASRLTVQSLTGHMPHIMLFGREMRLPIDFMF